jgi:NAD(P)H-nitrite reductase large subunit
MRRYVIIGTGPAGISASEAIRCHDQSGEILLIGDERYGFYSRPGVAYFLNGEISEQQLFPFSQQDFRRLNVRMLHAKVTRLHPEQHQVELENRTRLPYDRLLIATGASAIRSSVPGNDLQGVVKMDTLDDVHHIIKLTRKARSAVVVGGGITALELVEGLRARGVKTHYFLRGDRYWGNVLDETESQIIERRLQDDGCQIHTNTELAEILGKNGRVAGVRTADGRQIACEIVGVAIGVLPRLDLAKTAGLNLDRGIMVNEYLETSAPDIFAAGDVAQVYDPFTKKSVLDSLWGPARDQGTAAGMNMASQSMIYSRLTPFNVTRLASLTTTIIGAVGKGADRDLAGIARGDSEVWRLLPDSIAAQNRFVVNRLRILVGENSLIGALVMGDQTLSQPLQNLIARRVDITPIRDRMLQPRAPLADLIAEFWTRWRMDYAPQQP